MLIALTLMVAMSVHAGKDTLAMEDSAMVILFLQKQAFWGIIVHKILCIYIHLCILILC